MKTHPKASQPLPIEILAEKFTHQLTETARRCLAMRRQFPGAVCRWRRAARTGPKSKLALVFIWRKGEPPQTEVWPYAQIEKLAAEITDEEVHAEIVRSAGDSDAESTE
jgi:hypothetical protein